MITPDMAKPGPKPRPPAEVRSKVVALKTTPPSWETWKKASRKAKKSLNEWAITILDEAAKNQLPRR